MAENESKEKIIIDFQTNADESKKSVDGLNASINTTVDETDKLANAQAGSAKASKAHVAAIEEIAPASTDAVKSLVSMGKAMWVLVANPIGAVLTAIAAVIGVLFLAFRSFTPLVDKVEQSFAALGAVVNVIKNTFVGLVTGTKSLSEAFNGLGGEMEEAASRTTALVKAQQDLEDVMASQEVQTARNRAEINKLNVALKNRTLSEEERLKISEKIVKKENEDYLQRKAIVDQEVRNAREAIAIKAQFTAKEIKLLKETGDATKELAESRGGNYDEEYKALNDARKKAIALEDEATVNLEKQYSRQDKIAEELAAKREKREAEQEAKRQKQVEAEKKRVDAILEERKRLSDTSEELASFVAHSEQKATDDKKARDDKEEQERKDRLARQLQQSANNAKSQKNIDEAIARNKAENQKALIDAGEGFVNAAKVLAGKNKQIQKAAIIADGAISLGKAGVNTAEAVTKDLAKGFPISVPLVAADIAVGAASAVSIISNTKKALQSVGGGSISDSGQSNLTRSAVGATPQTGFQASNENQIATSISKAQGEQAPVKAYVVGSEVKTQLTLDAKIVKENSFG